MDFTSQCYVLQVSSNQLAVAGWGAELRTLRLCLCSVRKNDKLASNVHDEFRDVQTDVPPICHFWPNI